MMEMGSSDDNLFFTCLEDKSQTIFLLNSTEDICETPNLNIEPIFTEILYNGNNDEVRDFEKSLNSIENLGQELTTPNAAEKAEKNEPIPTTLGLEENTNIAPVEIPEIGFITTDFFTPPELLLQLINSQNEDLNLIHNATDNDDDSVIEQTVNGTETVLLSDEEENDDCNLIKSNLEQVETTDNQKEFKLDKENKKDENSRESLKIVDVQQSDDTSYPILNSITNGNDFNSEGAKLKDFYEIVTTLKCKMCSFLCENEEDMIKHLKDCHLHTSDKVPKKLTELDNKKTNLENKSKRNLVNDEFQAVPLGNKAKPNIIRKSLFLCSQCNIGYTKKENLKSHIMAAHQQVNNNKKREKLILENKEKITNQSRVKRIEKLVKRQNKTLRKLKCSVPRCDIRFINKEVCKKHESCHINGQGKKFACIQCGEKFSMWRICSSHMWKIHQIDMDLLTCPMCNKYKSATMFRLSSHMTVHINERPFLCSTCGKTFKTLSQMCNHQIIHKEIPTGWASQQQCEICRKFFANSKSLKKHIQCVHDKYKPFICNICGHKTSRKAMLELHLRQHTGEKPHQCPHCEYKTGDHNSLRRHMMRHSGSTKYSCPHCDYQCIQSTSFKKHIANKHPGMGGTYYCTLCTFNTVSESTYNSHLIDHKTGIINVNTNIVMNEQIIEKEQEADMSQMFLNSSEKENEPFKEYDDETQSCLSLDNSDETVDTGGITIPEGIDYEVITLPILD